MAKTDKRRSSKSTKSKLPKEIELAIRAADDKKADALVVLDLRKTVGFTDYFFICSGSNQRQVRAIADAVRDALAATGARPTQVEGYDRSEWILLDYFDFVVHIFAPETRVFYGLERLWGNAEHLDTDAILAAAHR
jgi:ribosome-associated protein